jgi:uncharacterized protein (UPF0248 family)
MILRNFLNRLFWDELLQKERANFALTYIHRGAPEDEKTINCIEIKSVLATGFEVFSDEFNRVVKIPYHRIKYIVNLREEKVIYRKASKENDPFKEGE